MNNKNPNPTGKGGFTPGRSGNPSGRPKRDERHQRIEDIAKEHTEDAIAALADIANNPESNERARVAAAEAILDRGWGRPVERSEQGTPGAFGRESPEEIRKRINERKARLDNPEGNVTPIRRDAA